MKSRVLAAVLTTLLCAVLACPVLAESFPQTRDGWQVGFGVGGGSAGGSGGGSREGGGAGTFHVGYAFQPQVALELNSNAWTKSQDGATVTLSVTTASLSYYPAGAQGLVLRAGAGFGDESVSASSGNLTFSASQTGFGATAGVGYEFRVKRTFAIGPQVDFGWISINGGSDNYINGALGFHWYFIPQK